MKHTLQLQPGCFLIFHQIQPKMFLNCFLNLKTFNDNNSPDKAIVMQEKDAQVLWDIYAFKNCLCKSLFETQPA